MDKSLSPITGYGFAKRIIDYYGTNSEHGAGDVLLEMSNGRWCDWLVSYDSFYCGSSEMNEERFNAIIKDICALYNTRGGVVIIENNDDPRQILRSRGLQDYAKDSCDTMCKCNSVLGTKKDRQKIKRIFEAKVICHRGREVVALLVKSAGSGLRYPIGNDTNHYYARDENRCVTRPVEGITTANSALDESWNREDYLNRDDLQRKLVELSLPVSLPKTGLVLSAVRDILSVFLSAKKFFAALVKVSRFGFIAMTLLQFLPICNEVCMGGGLSVVNVFKTFVLALIPFVAPYWAAQGGVHTWGMTVGVAYLVFFWPYVLLACAGMFTVVDAMMVKRGSVLKVGAGLLLAFAIAAVYGVCKGYVACQERIRSIGGYAASDGKVEPAIGMNDMVVRSVEAVEYKIAREYDEQHPRDIYGMIRKSDSRMTSNHLEMLHDGLMRVEAMYKPNEGRQTSMVEVLGGPDQGLIECLSELSRAVEECRGVYGWEERIEYASLGKEFDRAWQKVCLANRKFFARANEIGVYNTGSR